MLYMVIERFKDPTGAAVYRRFDEMGRMMPDELEYLDSWIEQGGDRCFQLMRTDDAALFDEWTANWDDLVEFEIIPVITSLEARERATR